MANARADVNKWIDDVARKRFRHTVDVDVRLQVAPGKTFADLLSTDTLRSALQQFVADGVVGSSGILHTEYHERASADSTKYMPKHLTLGGTVTKSVKTKADERVGGDLKVTEVRKEKELGDMRLGFARLWQALSQTQDISTGGMIGVGVGPGAQVLGLRLHEFMRVGGSQKAKTFDLDTLFYAVEFGTGIAKNVGGSQWVRTTGPTKELWGTGPKGSWWLGRVGQGMLMTGQRGFHFLYDEVTRKPREDYAKWVRDNLPRYIYAALGLR